MAEAPRIAVATFGRVYDMTPQQDALTLDELAAALTRFQLKTQLGQRIDKELSRFRRGEGPWIDKLKRFSPDEVEHQIKREAKTDLRIWTPALFAPGSRRESEGLVHVSALVFDIDDRLRTDDVRDALRAFWHVGHSTWSHTPERPKFRVCIPFAQAIDPEDFLVVWDHGDQLIGGGADRTGRFLARGMALPAVPRRDSPRVAWVHIAPLFDPVGEGLARPSLVPPPEPTGLSFMRPDASEAYVSAEVATDAVEDDPWSGGATLPTRPPKASAASAPSTTASARSPAMDEVLARLAAIERRLDALERGRS
ncbi:MAG: hypothetical protein IT385_26165 [Deltaproteobacteria bacterium]|nr:hypothetical protein [Deltaproteobacteria bacterium]